MVPIRKFANAIGVSDENIFYDENTRQVSLTYNGSVINLAIGDVNASVNGEPVTLDVPAAEIDGRTLVPLRFISETFEYTVDYTEDDSALNVYLTR